MVAFPNLENARLEDEVLRQVVLGYSNAEAMAPFVAPVITVNQRSGSIKKFDRSNFAVLETRRSPGQNIPSRTTTYTKEKFNLEQHAMSGEVTWEDASEARNGQAREDLRRMAAQAAAESLVQSWEARVSEVITDASLYEAANVVSLAGAEFDLGGTNPEVAVDNAKELVRAQIGNYPNAAVVDADTYRALRRNDVFQERTKHTTPESITEAMLAGWLNLKKGMKVALRSKLDPVSGELVDIYPSGNMVIFYHPESSIQTDSVQAPNTVFQMVHGNNRSRPAAWYTYQHVDSPVAQQEELRRENMTYYFPVIVEQAIVPVGLGTTGRIGAAVLLQDTVL